LVTEIQITPIPAKDGLVGFCSCILDGQFFLGNVAIHTSFTSPDGYRLTFPSLKLSTGKQSPCFYPISREAYEALKRPIIKRFNELMGELVLNHCKEKEDKKFDDRGR
jgi:DNA-binding cell septation regulator SpoVG